MKQSIFSLSLSPRSLWIGVVGVALMIFCGLIGNAEAATQDNSRAIDSMYTCIDNQTKRASKSLATSGSEIAFRSSLSKDTLKGNAERKAYINKDKRFTNEGLNQKYQELDRIVEAGNRALDSNGGKVARPNYHIENIKAERNNIFTQLDRKAEIARDPNTTTANLITNHCEMSWGLRINVIPGRKWQAQINNDKLNAQNAVATAYWIAAKRPEGKDPTQYDKQISQFQEELNALVIPRVGLVAAGPLNPKDGNANSAFKDRMYDPQKKLTKKIATISQDLKKAMKPKTIKATKKNKYNYVQLPVNNDLYYIYGSDKANAGDGGNTPDYQRYGKPALVKMFQDVAQKFHDKYPETKLVAGDFNAVSGHASHKNGVDMDVYAQNYMAADMRSSHRNNESVERSVALGKMFMDTKKIDLILYNDSVVINKVNAYAQKNHLPGRMQADNSSHEFHFHVRLKAKAGPYDNCAQAGAAKDCFK